MLNIPQESMMPVMSYAQNREDVLLSRVFTDPTGFYIDVGAAHPVGHSVTKWFYERGWHGVNVEPQPSFFALLAADRLRDVNLNAAVSATHGECTFHEVKNSIGCSTVNPIVAEQLRASGAHLVSYTVRTIPLRDICEKYVTSTIDFLKIDAEGHELTVLQSGDFQKWRPRVMVIENTDPETWQPFVLANGYRFATFDGINRYYVRFGDEQLIPILNVPVNVTDNYQIFEYEHRIHMLEAELEATRRAA